MDEVLVWQHRIALPYQRFTYVHMRILQSATKLMSCVNRHFSFLHCSQPLLSIFLGHVWLEMG